MGVIPKPTRYGVFRSHGIYIYFNQSNPPYSRYSLKYEENKDLCMTGRSSRFTYIKLLKHFILLAVKHKLNKNLKSHRKFKKYIICPSKYDVFGILSFAYSVHSIEYNGYYFGYTLDGELAFHFVRKYLFS